MTRSIHKNVHRHPYLLILIIAIIAIIIITVVSTTWSIGSEPVALTPEWEIGDWWSYDVIDEDGRFLFLGQAEQMWMYGYDRRSTVVGKADANDRTYYIVADRYTTDYGTFLTLSYHHTETLSSLQQLDVDILEFMKTNNMQPQFYSFPLEERKTWVVLPDHFAVVLGLEKIDIKTGTVKAFRIEHVEDGEQWALWYSPSIENVVRVYGKNVSWELTDWGHQSESDTFDQLMINLREMAEWDPVMAIIQADTLVRHGIQPEEVLEFKEEFRDELEDIKQNEGQPTTG